MRRQYDPALVWAVRFFAAAMSAGTARILLKSIHPALGIAGFIIVFFLVFVWLFRDEYPWYDNFKYRLRAFFTHQL